ncbi:uncharacterized protein ACLA_059510 [Aspergillus clavatus NRRL 1]|uniref:Uncharacterized protein n=1 Tax=Aspergillus clavatus (strain ATCC 1007 / CBS 513.65 / DSM 816 / NCTC 3887 / NRRL 1 / QM 1276 / 107) TaxID=344612 RepID=A1C4E4_ASPCL|nr:uncharacterized protein ACLA_059510 [Aspergillus clavatus NRRL 1]EAW15284.1 hypothetical protein ACLA_059510 [Aspergillus clavatus NRRL 1]
MLSVSRLLLSSSGKVDRRKLWQEAEELTRDIVETYLDHPMSPEKPPWTEQEHRFALWTPGPSVSTTDFFAVGGDSIVRHASAHLMSEP